LNQWRKKSTRAANPDFFRFYGMLVKTETPIVIYYCRMGTVLKGKMQNVAGTYCVLFNQSYSFLNISYCTVVFPLLWRNTHVFASCMLYNKYCILQYSTCCW